MGISVQWDNDEKTIIEYTFSGKWTWQDLFAALDKVQEMSDSVDHEVNAIINFKNADLMPSGSIFSLNGKKQAEKLARKANQARGTIVIAGANMFIRSVYDTFSKLDRNLGSGVRFTDTVAQARAYLAAEGAR